MSRFFVILPRGKRRCLVCTGAQARIESAQGVQVAPARYNESVIWHRGKSEMLVDSYVHQGTSVLKQWHNVHRSILNQRDFG
jgi:hypothetical protein